MAHGTLDPVISLVQAKKGLEVLNKAGASVEFFDYPMVHEICPDEVADIAEFIRAHGATSQQRDYASLIAVFQAFQLRPIASEFLFGIRENAGLKRALTLIQGRTF